MKKLSILFFLLNSAFAACAEPSFDPLKDNNIVNDLIHIPVALAVIYLVSTFIQTVIKLILDQQLKNKLIDQGASEDTIRRLMQYQKPAPWPIAIKWCFLLAGIGIALGLIGFFHMQELYAAAVIALCLSGAFLAYSFVIKHSANS